MAADPRIKHVVVVMMENRSFDHILGLTQKPRLDGTAPNAHMNPDAGGTPVYVATGAAYQGQLNPDVPHEFEDVDAQIFGVPRQATPNMQGFVATYQRVGGSGQNVMRCFEPKQLPVISYLASNYLVCNRWFASVPGPTSPNRAFAHFGTSFGRVDSGVIYTGHGGGIYERLGNAGVSAKLFYHSAASGTLGMTFLDSKYCGLWGDFEAACNSPDGKDLPQYSFVEPLYQDMDGQAGTDMHPDNNVLKGDQFIGWVYQCIRKQPALWESTVLLVVWDEHGGLYDHVVPPTLKQGDDFSSVQPPFAFDRLGVRVPAILVSPYVANDVCDVQFEHACIPATASRQFAGGDTPGAHTRELNANSFLSVLQGAKAEPPEMTFASASRALTAEHPDIAHPTRPASGLQLQHAQEVYLALSAKHPEDARKLGPPRIQTVKDVGQYLHKAMAVIHPDLNGGTARPAPKRNAKKGNGKKA
jgi:phospholipase C